MFHQKFQDMRKLGYDQRIQQLLQQAELRDPKATCSSGNKATHICVNPQCIKSSLHCEDCKEFQYHMQNSCQSVRLKALTLMINSCLQNKKTMVKAIIDQELKMMEKLQAAKEIILQRFGLSCLDKEQMKLVQSIYKSKEKVTMAGKDAAFIVEKLQKDKKYGEYKQAEAIAMFIQEIQRISDQIVSLEKKTLYYALKSHGMKIHSTILEQNGKDFEFIIKSLEDISKPKKFQLLYRASEHNFSSNSLCVKLKGIQNMLFIMKTESGKVIGGFTTAHQQYNKSEKSFLFSVTLKQKAMTVKSKGAFYTVNESGFRFGQSINYVELFISDSCKNYKNSYVRFQNKIRQYKSQVNTQEASNLFDKTQNGRMFLLQEYEVFRVFFQK